MTRLTEKAEKISVVHLTDDEREEYLEDLWVKHGLTPERILPWLSAHRSAEYWKLDNTIEQNASKAQKLHAYGIYLELRGATYDHQMLEMAIAIWESRERPEYVCVWGVDFYPIMDALLLILHHYMDSLAVDEKMQKDPYRADLNHKPCTKKNVMNDVYRHDIKNKFNSIEFSLDWITFHLRYYIAQYWQSLRNI